MTKIKMIITKNCKWCNNNFKAFSIKKTHCSNRCYHATSLGVKRHRMEVFHATTCSICGTENFGAHRFSVDHDHITGKFRGILCTSCNAGLGLFKDDVERMKKAITYLVNFQESLF